MANFFEGVGNLLKHPIDEAKWMFDSTKDVLKGDMKLKDVPGSHQDMMNDITVPILGDNKLAKNSDAVAGAVVGGVLAAPFLSGGSGFGGFGTEGAFSNYFKPSSLPKPGFDISNVGYQPGSTEAGMDFGSTSYEPTTEFGGAKAKKDSKFDLQAFGQMLQSIKPQQQQQISSSGRVGGSFRFDPSQYQNKLAQREFDQMYGAQPYTPLT